MSVPVVAARSPRDLLAYIPHALGFHPRECVVILGLRPPRGRLGLTTRTDLTELLGPQGHDLAAYLARALRRDGAEEVFLALYADAPLHDLSRDPRVGAVIDVLAGAHDIPEPVDLVLVGRDRFRSMMCEDVRCCPPQGQPLAEVTASEVTARFVASGSAPMGTRAELAVGREEDEKTLARVRRERRSAAARRRSAREIHHLDRWREGQARWIAAVCRRDEAEEPDAVMGARLAVALRDIRVRDAVMMWVTLADPARDAGRLTQPTLQERWAAAPGPTKPPDPGTTDVLTSWLRCCARVSVGRDRAAALGTGAWLAWYRGEGALSEVLARQSLAEDDRYRLAALTQRLLQGGVAPPWVQPPTPAVG